MMDKNKQTELINPASINTEEKLTNFLIQIGFKSRPISRKTSDAVILNRETKADLPPQRFLSWQDNEGFENSFAIASIEEGAFYVRYYRIEADLFDIWEKFSGEVEIEAIRKSIRSAVTLKEVAIRYYFFWPERMKTGESIRSILSDLEFKSRDINWPDGLPSAGESLNAPHQVIAANEHNLDTDAIVSLEDQTVNVYYRDSHSNNFKEWANLVAKKNFSDQLPYVKCSDLYLAIMTAMTNNKETDKFLG